VKEVLEIGKVQEMLAEFAKAREWEQFHTPKNISMALSVEASELVEIFQWLTAEQSSRINEDEKRFEDVKDEIADIMLYLIRMTDLLGIDVQDALMQKMAKNKKKYPVDKSKGHAKKYTDF